MTSFTKLFSSIVTSSIWNEDDYTRLVWITMLALADKRGRVWASKGGLAHSARVPRDCAERALERLLSPDEDSRTPDNEGRRIATIEGGWQILNYPKYRDLRDEDTRNEYMREYMRKKRAGVNTVVSNVNFCKPPLAKAEAEAEADSTTTSNDVVTPEHSAKPKDSEATTSRKHLPDELFIAELKRHYPQLNVDSELRKMDAWLLTKPGRQKTRKFVVNWLNRVDPGLPNKGRRTEADRDFENTGLAPITPKILE